MVKSRTLTLLSLLLAASCTQDSKPLTQLVLVSDTDVSNVDAVQFLVRAEDGSHEDEMSVVPRTGANPAYVSVVREEGSLGPLQVTAFALKNGERTGLSRTQRVAFVPDQTRVVKLHLAASCIGKSCGATETCSEVGCTPIEVPEEQLEGWGGAPPALKSAPPPVDGGTPHDGGSDSGVRDAQTDAATPPDAGPMDAGNDAGPTDAGADAGSGLTACDGGSYDLSSDPYHCGLSCAAVTTCGDGTQNNTIRACSFGRCCDTWLFSTCTLDNKGVVCKAGYGDCYDDSSLLPYKMNSCESNLATSATHCGKCGNACTSPQTCVAGVCQ